jgi:hypothetical protein
LSWRSQMQRSRSKLRVPLLAVPASNPPEQGFLVYGPASLRSLQRKRWHVSQETSKRSCNGTCIRFQQVTPPDVAISHLFEEFSKGVAARGEPTSTPVAPSRPAFPALYYGPASLRSLEAETLAIFVSGLRPCARYSSRAAVSIRLRFQVTANESKGDTIRYRLHAVSATSDGARRAFPRSRLPRRRSARRHLSYATRAAGQCPCTATSVANAGIPSLAGGRGVVRSRKGAPSAFRSQRHPVVLQRSPYYASGRRPCTHQNANAGAPWKRPVFAGTPVVAHIYRFNACRTECRLGIRSLFANHDSRLVSRGPVVTRSSARLANPDHELGLLRSRSLKIGSAHHGPASLRFFERAQTLAFLRQPQRILFLTARQPVSGIS